MTYQKCPVCDGIGNVSGGYFTRAGDSDQWAASNATEICQVCAGTGIIDEVTGKPPPKEDGTDTGEDR